MTVPPYRVAADDLDTLDAKTREGMTPLIDALNVTIPHVVQAINGNPPEAIFQLELKVDATVAAAFPLVFKNPLPSAPRWVGMVCVPKDPDHSLATPFVMQGFSVTDLGLISIPWITGLTATNSYSLTFVLKT